MTTFRARRWRNLLLLAGAIAQVWLIYEVLALSLRPTGIYTGWTLMGLMLLLASYNLYKRVPFIPAGPSAGWLQLHIYTGLLTIVLYFLHVGWRVPPGWLGKILAGLYLAVAGSGLAGLALSRWLAPRLATRGEEVIYERIPVFHRRIRAAAEHLVVQAAERADSTAIPEFYARRLAHFFAGPRHVVWHLLHSTYPRHALLTGLAAQRRYLSEEEEKILAQLGRLVETKDDLDYQFALQSALKYWLFVHIPLAYGLLVFVVLHIVLVYAFAGVVW